MSQHGRNTMLVVTIALGGLWPIKALADSKVEIGANLGAHLFASNTELGAINQRVDAAGLESAARLGVRVGYLLGHRFTAELEVSWMPTDNNVDGRGADVFGGRLQARYDVQTGKLRPFVFAGYGGMWLAAVDGMQLARDVDQAFHFGVGATYSIAPKWSVRADLASLIVPGRTDGGAAFDTELTVSAVWHMGGGAAPMQQASPSSAPRSVDEDGDGLFNVDDECPRQAEDRDGFADTDGCPELDNDADQIADAADKCPNDAETRNGYQDTDGCPDQVLNELTGITFEPNSARFDASSVAMLERAYQVLAGNPILQVEIGGHTSSEGDAAHNQLLSLQRAEAVKAYLIARGIAEPRLHTAGYGAEKPVADNYSEPGRAKNRRIEFRILADIK